MILKDITVLKPINFVILSDNFRLSHPVPFTLLALLTQPTVHILGGVFAGNDKR